MSPRFGLGHPSVVRAAMRGGVSLPPDFANLAGWVDADDLDGSSNSTLVLGDPIGTLVNKGHLGGTFTGDTGGRPTFRTVDGAGGGPCMRYTAAAGVGMTSSLAAGAWTFLHSGTGSTIYSVLKISTSHYGTVIGTGNGASTQRGFGHRVNTSFRPGAYAVGDGSLRFHLFGAINTIVSGTHHLLASRLLDPSASSDVVLNVDSVVVASGDTSALSVLDPFGTAVLGRTPNGDHPLDGDLGDLLIYDTRHDNATVLVVQEWLESKRGAFPQ